MPDYLITEHDPSVTYSRATYVGSITGRDPSAASQVNWSATYNLVRPRPRIDFLSGTCQKVAPDVIFSVAAIQRIAYSPGVLGVCSLVWPLVERDATANADPIERAIRDSQWILDLDDDWDAQGSDGFTFATWNRAANLLRALSSHAQLACRSLPVPKISPADEGSIDLFWQFDDGSLLLNVCRSDHWPTYDGERVGKQPISGEVRETEELASIAEWVVS